ncbi:YesL family protein [Lederbergia citri]|uniref:YesL family protein n=1 Tax=Lederbergia citri TaxID=2833580 RepID=A0A942TC98_9BACI|nr:DUF624 domain-containing protein [Lederbergia citri]MBS4194131.1 YesL family protein [Lederbergia citri]
MYKRREFGQGLFFIISNYIYWFTLTNIYFIFCNIIFFFAIITLEPIISNIIFIFLALIPTGPAITALCYVMDKLVREGEISPTKDFFLGYKLNFKDALKVWLPLLTAFFILIIDLQYFYQENTKFNQIMTIVFLAALFFLISFLLYVFPITAKYKFRIRDTYKLSIYYSFKKLKSTTGNIGILIISLFLIHITTNFLCFLIASVVSYLLTLNSREVMDEIKLNYTK